MKHISNLDGKILYALGNDARIGYKELAQDIGSKKTIVANHIQRLVQQQIIWKFVPVVSIHRLGIFACKCYVKLQGLNRQDKQRLIKQLVEDPRINWVAESIGAWDILWSTYAHNILDFAKKKNEFLNKYGDYIQEYAITILEDALVFNRDYLVNKPLSYRKEFTFGGRYEVETVDTFQKDILRYIRNDGRFHITKLANALHMNVRTAMAKIADLEKKKILQGHTVFVDLSKIGMRLIKLCLYLQDYTHDQYNLLLALCKSERQVIHIIKSIGQWDLELECEVESIDFIYSFIEQVKSKHPRIVKKIDVVMIKKEHKLDFFPEWY